MSFKLIVVQFSSHWQTYQSLNKQIWKVVKRFNANSISKVRKLMVAGREALQYPPPWLGQWSEQGRSAPIIMEWSLRVFIYREQKMPSFVRCTIGFPLPLDTLSVKNIDLHFYSIWSLHYHSACRLQNAEWLQTTAQLFSCFYNSCLGICVNRPKVILTDRTQHKARYCPRLAVRRRLDVAIYLKSLSSK